MNNKETFYAKLSKYYDKIFPLSLRAEKFVLQELFHPRQTRLLDIGCGTGSLSIALSSQVKAVTAVDLDDEMISKAIRKNVQSDNPVEFKILNMLDIETHLGCRKFDTLICLGNTIAHLLKIKDIELFFKAAACVLVPGGKLILQGLNYNYILDKNVSSLPLIENGDIRFIRNYQHAAQRELLEFRTEIRVKGAAAVSASTLHNPLRPDLLCSIIESAGLSKLQLFGGFDRSAFSPDSLPLIITGILD